MRYFKGTEKSTGRHMMYLLYDEPQPLHILNNATEYIMVAYAFDQDGRRRYATIEDCQNEHYILREISEEEYRCYRLLQFLLTEMYQNQFTSGFPKFDVDRIIRELAIRFKDYQNVIRGSEPKGKPTGIYNGEVS